MRKTNVRKHTRKTGSGKIVPVNKHIRTIRTRLKRFGVKTRVEPKDPKGFIVLNKEIIRAEDKILKTSPTRFFGNIELVEKIVEGKVPANKEDDIDVTVKFYSVKSKEPTNKISSSLIGEKLLYVSQDRRKTEKWFKKFKNAKREDKAKAVLLNSFLKSEKKFIKKNKFEALAGFLPTFSEFNIDVKPTKYVPVKFLD